MKNISCLVFTSALLAVLIICSCAASTVTPSPETTTPSPIPTPSPTPPVTKTVPVPQEKTTEETISFDTKNPIAIQYDGLGEGIQNYQYTGLFLHSGAGHMVWFTAPAYPFRLTTISMKAGATAKGHGSLEGKNFAVVLWDKNTGNKIWSKDYPWQIYDAGIYGRGSWQDIQIPNVIVKKDFYIEVVTFSDPPVESQTGTKGSMIGSNSTMTLDFETTQEVTRSYISFNGKPIPNSTWKGNWYIRVIGNCPLK